MSTQATGFNSIQWKQKDSLTDIGEWSYWRDPKLSLRFSIRLLSPMQYFCYLLSPRANQPISLGRRVTKEQAKKLCEQQLEEQVIRNEEEERITNKNW